MSHVNCPGRGESNALGILRNNCVRITKIVLSSLLDPNELIRVGSKAGGILVLEAAVVNTLLTNANVKKELDAVLERTSKTVK